MRPKALAPTPVRFVPSQADRQTREGASPMGFGTAAVLPRVSG